MKKILYFLLLPLLFACNNTNEKRKSLFADITSFIQTNVNKNVNNTKINILSKEEYIKWIIDDENGLNQSKEINEFTFKVQYRPHEFEALLNMSDEDNLTQSSFKEKLQSIKETQFFTLTISSNNTSIELLQYNIQDNEEYYARVEYYSFNIHKDIILIDGEDTLECKLSHFERSYSTAPEIKIHLVFPEFSKSINEDACREKVISINDRVFSCGIINIKIDKESICSIPSLKLQ